MGDCVRVYGVMLVGVLSRGVVWLMLCVFNQAHVPCPEGKRRRKRKKNTKTPKTFKIIIIIMSLKNN